MSGSGTYGYSGTVVTETIVNGGSYTITAVGGSGGSAARANGGYAAEVTGTFALPAGAVITIVVGGEGGPGASDYGGGGGGGSFVIENFQGTRTALLIAGGGGGAYNYHAGGNASQAAVNAGAGGAGGGALGGGGGGYVGGSAGVGNSGQAGTGKGASSSYLGGSTGSPNQPDGGGFGGGGGGYYGVGGGGGGYGGGAGGANRAAGGGGGSLDTGTNPSATEAVVAGAGSVTSSAPLCFLRGTRILTPTGEVRVEDLQIGDPVVTRFGGIQPVRWLGRHSHLAGDRANTPVCIRSGALGDRLPARDLYVSPGHSVLVDGTLLIARLLVNGVTVTQDWSPPRIDYVHIELAAHDCVIAEGAWAETYADAHISRTGFDNAAEHAALYPEDGPAPEAFTLCAARPERGPKLEAALRPVIARAHRALPMAAGPLQGSIDHIGGAWHVQGWAYDASRAELPVLLQVELDGQVIGAVAACGQRGDLAQAGFGRCAFTFTSPVRLRPELLGSLRVRRAGDGADLPMDPRCAARIATTETRKPGLRLVA